MLYFSWATTTSCHWSSAGPLILSPINDRSLWFNFYLGAFSKSIFFLEYYYIPLVSYFDNSHFLVDTASNLANFVCVVARTTMLLNNVLLLHLSITDGIMLSINISFHYTPHHNKPTMKKRLPVVLGDFVLLLPRWPLVEQQLTWHPVQSAFPKTWAFE